MDWSKLRVPASSANLGPGFDALGMALAVYLNCRFRPAPRLLIQVEGCDATHIPRDETNLVWRTAHQVAAHAGRQLSPFELRIQNNIPLGKGMGSSAAALIAGVVIADSLLHLRWTRERILDEAARLEGHPDNVAACVFGGVVASAIGENGEAQAIRMGLPPDCAIALVVPGFVLPTAKSRAVLPDTYTREEIVFNLQRVGLLIAAFATGQTGKLAAALSDKLHQPFRASLVPGLSQILSFKADGLYGSVLSGAGPSVLVFYKPGFEDACEQVAAILGSHGSIATILYTAIDPTGYVLSF